MRPTPFVSMRCDSQVAFPKAKSKIFDGKNMHIRLRHNIVRQLLETRVISLEFVMSKLNLTDLLTKPLNKKLVEETSRGMRLMPIIEIKSGGNPTYQNGNSIKQVHMGNNKSLVDLRCPINSNYMRVYPYDVDRAYSALIKVECLLLTNTIFHIDGMFKCRTYLMDSPI